MAFRLARREARRRRVRSVAIVLTLALPIVVATTVDVVARSNHLTVSEQLDRSLGGAQATVSWSGAPITQAPDPSDGTTAVAQAEAALPELSTAPTPPPSELLPPGAVLDAEALVDQVLVSSRDGGFQSITGVDIRSTAVAPLVVVDSGRAPAAPGEAAIPHRVAVRLGVGIGARLQIPGTEQNLLVVGIAHRRYLPRDDAVFTLPEAAERLQRATAVNQWYVSATAPVTWAQVKALNARGYVVRSRSVVLHPPSRSDVPFYQSADVGPVGADSRARNQAITALLAGMVLLEIILLAGPAFAVGARRRRYELALVAASGGERRHLAGMVLADGTLLGGLAAVTGAAIGIGAARVFVAMLPGLTGRIPGHFTLVPTELIGIASLALLSGLLAALVPAYLATRDTTAAVLASRRAPTRRSWRPTIAGIALVAAALVIGLTTLESSGSPLRLVAAAALGELGSALIAPGLLSVAGHMASRLPLWPRLALRDAARNRSAAAPAIAAIIAVVAASAAIFIYTATSSSHDRKAYQPYIFVGDSVVALNGPQVTGAAEAARVLRADVPDTEVSVLQGAVSASCAKASDACRRGSVALPALAAASPPAANISPILVDDGTALAGILGGHDGQDAGAALRSGKAVVFDPALIDGGTVTVEFSSGQPSRVQVPAVAVHSAVPFAQIVIPPTEARTFDIDASAVAIYLKNTRSQPPSRIRAVNLDLARLGIPGLLTEKGYTNHLGTGLVAVAVGDLVLTFGAALAATALISVDGRDDMITLAAVGAAPGGRRRLAMARAGVICLVGAVFGTVAGVIPGVGLVWRLRSLGANHFVSGRDYPLTIPWMWLGFVVLAAPLLAVLTAAVVTRARLPADRRAGAW